MKRYPTLLIIWEIQIQTTEGYHFTHSRRAINKKQIITSLGRLERNGNPHRLLLKIQNSAATFENSLVVPPIVKPKLLHDPRIYLSIKGNELHNMLPQWISLENVTIRERSQPKKKDHGLYNSTYMNCAE